MRSEVRDWGKRQEGIEIGHNASNESQKCFQRATAPKKSPIYTKCP